MQIWPTSAHKKKAVRIGGKYLDNFWDTWEEMQLDIDGRPSANTMTFRPGLTHLPYDLDPRPFSFRDMN